MARPRRDDNKIYLHLRKMGPVQARGAQAKCKPGRPAYAKEDRSLLNKSVWLLTEIARKIGILDDLRSVFDNVDKVNDILSLALIPLLQGL